MRFQETELKGAYLVETERITDARGYFARTWCQQSATAAGLHVSWVQHSVSYNEKSGTLRGMHYQVSPYEETKLVSCIAGALYDVILDLRPASPTYKSWRAFELSEKNGKALVIPAGFAHGFLTLSDATTVQYCISEYYRPEAQRGVRFDDPTFAIQWPVSSETILSERDLRFPLFEAITGTPLP